MPRESTIRIFRSDTAAAVPSLTAGEIAVNIPDQRLFVGNSTGGVIPFFGNGVSGINGITGGVSITSGSGITITQTGKQITVASSITQYTAPLATSSVTGVASFRAADFDVSTTGSVSLTGTIARTNTAQSFSGLQTFTNGISGAGATFAGMVSVADFLARTVGGDEGGELKLGLAVTNTTLTGTNVTIDVYQNRLRIFESGGNNRGYFMDLSTASNGVGSQLATSTPYTPPLATSSVTGVASFRAADFDVSITGSVSLTGTVARTNAAQTFSGLQVFSSGLSANGLTGTILTPAQTNITSLGTLTSLNTAGITSTQRVTISSGGLSVAGNIDGTIGTAAQPNITSLGTLTSLNSAGLTSTQRVTISSGGLSVAGNIDGTIGTAAQPNITSLGSLTTLTTAGLTSTQRVNVSAGGIVVQAGGLSVTGGANLTGGSTFFGDIEVFDGAFIRTGGLSVTGGIAGTILTPTQTNITSVGTLTSLTTSGLLSTQALNVVAGATFGIDIYAPNIVTGVNGITGAVSITSGSNITITQSGKTITIASSGGGSSPPLATSSVTGVASFRAADFDVSITGSVSLTGNVTRTNIANTFTALQSFTAGLSAAGGLTFGSDLSVNGNINATTKSFVITHPTKPGMTLRYGSLEGPENGVYVRGMLQDCDTIELPEYWRNLVDENTITVNLTPIGSSNSHFVKSIGNNQVIVGSRSKKINCFYIVFGERKDVPKLTVEY